jgi:hypothetical protein
MSEQESSGRNYYDNQFNSRIDDIRGDDRPRPQPASSSWGTRGGLGLGGFAVLVVIRLMVAGCVVATRSAYPESDASDGDQQPGYNSYDSYNRNSRSNDPEKRESEADFQRRQEEERRQDLARRAAERREPVYSEPAEDKNKPTTQPDRTRPRDDTRPRPNPRR